jgi:hypothetical protein
MAATRLALSPGHQGGFFSVVVLPIEPGDFTTAPDPARATADYGYEHGVSAQLKNLVQGSYQSHGDLLPEYLNGQWRVYHRFFRTTIQGVPAHARFTTALAGDHVVVLTQITNGVGSEYGQRTGLAFEAIRHTVTLADRRPLAPH